MSDIDVYVYPNTSGDYDLAETAKYAVEAGLDNVTSNTNIGTYTVELRTPYPSQSTGTRREFFDDFRYWREQYGYTETGCHMGVSTAFGGGLADGGQYNNAFSMDANCVAGSTYGGGAYFENVAIQEMAHTLIDPGLRSVAELIGQSDEHTLGMVYDQGQASPMISGYWDRGLGNAGRCRNDRNASGNTTYTTGCTDAAIEATWLDRTGGGGGGGSGIEDGATYVIRSVNSGKALDVEGAASFMGGNVHQWTYYGNANQHWTAESVGDGYYRLVATHSGHVLDVSGVSQDNGATVQQWEYVGGQNQEWAIEDIEGDGYRISARHSGKALDVAGFATEDGGNVQQWDWYGSDNQRWTFEQV